MLSTESKKPNIQWASPGQAGVKRLNMRTKKAIGKRMKVLIVESIDWMKAGMELYLPESEAMELIKSFKAKAVR